MMVAALWPGDVKQEGDNGLGVEHVGDDHTQGLPGVGLVDAKEEAGADDGGQRKNVKYGCQSEKGRNSQNKKYDDVPTYRPLSTSDFTTSTTHKVMATERS